MFKLSQILIFPGNLCAGCKMDCLGDDYGNFRCGKCLHYLKTWIVLNSGFMTCEERDCESEGMDCKPLMNGGTQCVEKGQILKLIN